MHRGTVVHVRRRKVCDHRSWPESYSPGSIVLAELSPPVNANSWSVPENVAQSVFLNTFVVFGFI